MKAMLVKALFADSSTAVDSAMMHESTELALTVKLKALFPLLPDEVLMRAVPDLSNAQNLDGSLLPWNRRKRRRLDQAKQLVVHLFSGPDQRFWEKELSGHGVEVLCVNLNAVVSADLQDDTS